MRNKILSIVVLSVLNTLFSGCAAKSVSLVDENQVTVEKQDGDKVKILWTDVYQQDGQAWAYGALKQRGISPGAVKTHVDVRVLSQDGSVHYETFSEDVYVPRLSAGKGPDWKRFKVQLAGTLPAGSKVTLKIHSGKHEDTTG